MPTLAMKASTLCALSLATLVLCACDRLGIPDPAKEAAAKDAEGRAVGSACRQAGRAIEDCFSLNPTAQKASVFAGWRDMNDYMTENKLEIVKPEIPPPGAKASAPATSDEQGNDAESSQDSESSQPARSSSRRRSRANAESGH